MIKVFFAKVGIILELRCLRLIILEIYGTAKTKTMHFPKTVSILICFFKKFVNFYWIIKKKLTNFILILT